MLPVGSLTTRPYGSYVCRRNYLIRRSRADDTFTPAPGLPLAFNLWTNCSCKRELCNRVVNLCSGNMKYILDARHCGAISTAHGLIDLCQPWGMAEKVLLNSNFECRAKMRGKSIFSSSIVFINSGSLWRPTRDAGFVFDYPCRSNENGTERMRRSVTAIKSRDSARSIALQHVNVAFCRRGCTCVSRDKSGTRLREFQYSLQQPREAILLYRSFSKKMRDELYIVPYLC